MVNILVTGGAGFIGSSFVRQRAEAQDQVIVIDNLTYAGNLDNLLAIENFNLDNQFIKGDIGDKNLISKILEKHEIDWVVNFAAESHVDNSIKNPDPFIETNILGTYNLLICARDYYNSKKKLNFKFLHISTDEVFGELDDEGKFSESSNYQPNSPYSASKASSDHLVRAFHHTYGLPTIITNCSNNYGPRQYPEKLIPFMIYQAINGKPLTIYGDGKNVRDWIYVDDHNIGVYLALTKGKAGETYCLGVNNEQNNNTIVNLICESLDKLKPRSDSKSYKEQITYITDRLGHDFRYAIDSSKAEEDLGFKASISFREGIENTIKWYLDNYNWLENSLKKTS